MLSIRSSLAGVFPFLSIKLRNRQSAPVFPKPHTSTRYIAAKTLFTATFLTFSIVAGANAIIGEIGYYEGEEVVADPDDDGDGISNIREGNGDFDGDGISNYLDLDSDNDGITDLIEGAADQDYDLHPNYLDVETDGDLILDIYESGIEYKFAMTLDKDIDGMIDVDIYAVGENGLADVLETAVDSGVTSYLIPNSDSVGSTDVTKDFKDRDTDNDGVFDAIEGGNIDTDRDGIADVVNAASTDTSIVWKIPPDSDLDGIPDFKDLDSDNDGISDVTESGVIDWSLGGRLQNYSTWRDNNNDGVLDFLLSKELQDSDQDGLNNIIDTDSDNDGVPDLVETRGIDVDGNGVIDNFTDDDNNGLSDTLLLVAPVFPEVTFPPGYLSPVVPPDDNENGIPDYIEDPIISAPILTELAPALEQPTSESSGGGAFTLTIPALLLLLLAIHFKSYPKLTRTHTLGSLFLVV